MVLIGEKMLKLSEFKEGVKTTQSQIMKNICIV